MLCKLTSFFLQKLLLLSFHSFFFSLSLSASSFLCRWRPKTFRISSIIMTGKENAKTNHHSCMFRAVIEKI